MVELLPIVARCEDCGRELELVGWYGHCPVYAPCEACMRLLDLLVQRVEAVSRETRQR